jgi:hypothetical protein
MDLENKEESLKREIDYQHLIKEIRAAGTDIKTIAARCSVSLETARNYAAGQEPGKYSREKIVLMHAENSREVESEV